MCRPFLATLSASCLALLAVLGAGCSSVVPMRVPRLAEPVASVGTLVVGKVNNLRPLKTGGQDLRIVGQQRSGIGIPYRLDTTQGREIDVAFREVMENAVRQAGFSVAAGSAAPAGVPTLELDVEELWCDGYMKYGIHALAIARLVDPVSRKAVVEAELKADTDAWVLFTFTSLHQAFDAALKDVQDQLAAFLSSDAAKKAVAGK